LFSKRNEREMCHVLANIQSNTMYRERQRKRERERERERERAREREDA
jgi:hypothetical protein